ncbi:MAG: molybdopterin-dependent oxidoreductase [Myxococcota bacterium]
MARITVDGIPLEVEDGAMLLEALDDAGVLMRDVTIPHYCWHPKLSIDGSCRLCQVEIEGAPKLQIACNTPVEDGMVVHTENERVAAARAGVTEMLLVNHPLDCPICDQAGECKLQDYAFEYGALQSRTREPRRALAKNVDVGPTIVLDQERCILCRRCVRFCREVPGTGELVVRGRGDRSVIDTFPDEPLDNPYSMNVADLCPVGALTTKDFRFKIRVWFLEDVPGICTGCARGCNVYLGVADNKVQRYQPRRNDAVNDTWICDAGRLSYKEIGAADRLSTAMLRGDLGVLEVVGFRDALQAAADRLTRVRQARGASRIGVVASPHATNEDLFVLRRFCDALGVETAGVAVVRGDADDLLLHAEKAANAAGARAMGFEDAAAVCEKLRRGALDALLVAGHDLLDAAYLGGVDGLGDLDTVVWLDTHVSDLQRVADVVLPTRVAAERTGTYTNATGHVQRVTPAVEPAFDARAEGAVIAALGQALHLDGFEVGFDARETSRALSEGVPLFRGRSFDAVGDAGLPLEEEA